MLRVTGRTCCLEVRSSAWGWPDSSTTSKWCDMRVCVVVGVGCRDCVVQRWIMALPGACYVWMLLCNVKCKEEKGIVCVLITPTHVL